MTAPTVVRFEPRGAVRDLFLSQADMILISGAAGTGKTVGALMKIHLACLKTKKVRALVLRKTHASLTASTLVTFREKVAAEALNAGLVRFYGGSAQEPAAFRYRNGSVIVVGGLDRASRLLSTEYDICLIDEGIEVTEEDVDTIVTRLRNGRLPYQQLIITTNPGPPTHHLKARADAGRCTLLYSRHEDNPRMFQGGEWTEYGKTYLARLDSLTGARYQRMRWGKWVSAEGLIYEEWDPAIHLVDRFPIPDSWSRFLAIDFGFTNPFVCQWWAEDGDGRLYLYREIYKTHRLVEDHAAHILQLVTEPVPDVEQKPGESVLDAVSAGRRRWTEPRPRSAVCDHDAEGRATLERHAGMSTTAAHKAVSEGIQAFGARLKVAGDGKPRLFILRDSVVERDEALVEAKKPTCTAEEFASYVWAIKPGGDLKEEPLKVDDHGCDSGRYLVAERDLGRTPRMRWLQ